MKRAILGILLMFQVFPAKSGHYFYSYSEWERLPIMVRANYLVGIYDGIVSLAWAKEALPWSDRISECIAIEAKMNQIQLANNLVSYVRVHPALQTGAAASAFGAYLTEVCQVKP